MVLATHAKPLAWSIQSQSMETTLLERKREVSQENPHQEPDVCYWGYSSPGKRGDFTIPAPLHRTELRARTRTPPKGKLSTGIPLWVLDKDHSCPPPSQALQVNPVVPNHCQIKYNLAHHLITAAIIRNENRFLYAIIAQPWVINNTRAACERAEE